MGKSWVQDKSQKAYLKSNFAAYHEARKNGSVDAFRSRLYNGWAQRWPEHQVVFPSWKEGDPPLTKDQMTIVGNAIDKREKQLYNYVRWHSSAKPVRTQNPSSLLSRYLRKTVGKGGKKSTRRRTILEIYSELYYDSKLSHKVKEETAKDPLYASLSKKQRSSRQMSLYRKIRAESWDMESDEVKTEVQRIYDQKHKVNADSSDREENKNDDDDDDDDEDDDEDDAKSVLQRQQDCVDIIGQVITSFLQEASEATGWAFYVLGGGLDKDGEIQIGTSSIGKTASGHSFQLTHKNFQHDVLNPWLDFLNLRHPIEERHRRAAMWAEDSTTVQDSTTVGPPNAAAATVTSPLLPQSVAPQSASVTTHYPTVTGLQSVTPQSVTPQSVTPQSVTPQSVTPQSSPGMTHDPVVAGSRLPVTNPTVSGSGPPLAQQQVPVTMGSSLSLQKEVVPHQATLPHMATTTGSSTLSQSISESSLQTAIPSSTVNLLPLQASLTSLNAMGPNIYAPNVYSSMTHSRTASLPSNLQFGSTLIPQPPQDVTTHSRSASLPSNLQFGSTLIPQNPQDVMTHSRSASPPSDLQFGSTFVSQTPQDVPLSFELSPMSKFMVATGQYQWPEDNNVNNLNALLPSQPDATLATKWIFPTTSTFTSTDSYQNMQTINPATGMTIYSAAPTSNILGHDPSNVMNLASNTTPLTTFGVTDKPKKRKSQEEENTQLILPDGSRRRHKPRRIDENYVPTLSFVGKKGRAGKKRN